ncbi:MAG: hypothetical protein CVU96_01000 [Firmicutes bacterium HGW-Firmicutes-20]|jgi:hypothetical protein|nr:MAG: hypothetical protein CVU96_01000 [Firmicutes bacterium HGW-Firmicutes-20]PKM65987.1 MAG: hypothetical protein CVU94_07920 [Firmicutes bacterium HGW-Firmicutes-19]
MIQYPEVAEIDGVEFRINTDYRVALQCMAISENAAISDLERSTAICILLFGMDVPVTQSAVDMAQKYLQCGKTTEEQLASNKDMDFEQDADFITASFMSDYHVDLSKAEMHWWQFVQLISGLTEHSILSKVRDIRNYNVHDLPDEKSKQRMRRAQQQVALKKKLSPDEQQALDEFEALFL